VLAREEERGPLAAEIGCQARCVAIELGGQFRVGRLVEQLDRGLEILRPREQVAPGLELGPEAVRLAQDPLSGALVVPEPGFAGQRLERRDALGLGLEVKDAPRSTGSVRPGPGWWMRPR
jgi:hypothetical protein